MKKISLLVASLILGTSLVWAANQEVNITVKGMVCSFCAQGIKKKFKAEKAVKAVKVNLTDKLVSLTFKEGQTLNDEQIQKIIEAAGYNVLTINRTGEQ